MLIRTLVKPFNARYGFKTYLSSNCCFALVPNLSRSATRESTTVLQLLTLRLSSDARRQQFSCLNIASGGCTACINLVDVEESRLLNTSVAANFLSCC